MVHDFNHIIQEAEAGGYLWGHELHYLKSGIQDSQTCIMWPMLKKSNKQTYKQKIWKHLQPSEQCKLELFEIFTLLRNAEKNAISNSSCRWTCGGNDNLFVSLGVQNGTATHPHPFIPEALLATMPWRTAGTAVFTRWLLLFEIPVQRQDHKHIFHPDIFPHHSTRPCHSWSRPTYSFTLKGLGIFQDGFHHWEHIITAAFVGT